MRSFLIWCFEQYRTQMKFKYRHQVYQVVQVDEKGYVIGVNKEGDKTNLPPRKAIRSLPPKAIRFFLDHWMQ